MGTFRLKYTHNTNFRALRYFLRIKICGPSSVHDKMHTGLRRDFSKIPNSNNWKFSRNLWFYPQILHQKHTYYCTHLFLFHFYGSKIANENWEMEQNWPSWNEIKKSGFYDIFLLFNWQVFSCSNVSSSLYLISLDYENWKGPPFQYCFIFRARKHWNKIEK